MRYASPLRYPGGKGALADFLSRVIELNELNNCAYYEPYAGGAGAALGLLNSRIVGEVFLNDADRRVYSFWRSALVHGERFAAKILSVPLNMREWRKQQAICRAPAGHSQFDVGFAAFYMNRCNRSGVLTGAGPIGGHEQRGKWRMDVRFNRTALAERVLHLSRSKKQIHVSNLDAIKFLQSYLPRGRGRKNVFVYLDPPYVVKGQRLYLNAYGPQDHGFLANYLSKQIHLKWIMSYDDSALVRDLYADCDLYTMPIKYTLQEKRFAHELIIAPESIYMPKTCTSYGQNAKLGRAV